MKNVQEVHSLPQNTLDLNVSHEGQQVFSSIFVENPMPTDMGSGQGIDFVSHSVPETFTNMIAHCENIA